MKPPSATHSAEETRTNSAIALFLALVTLVLFWPVSGFEFINFDDDEFVTENPNVLPGLTLKGIAWALTTTSSDYWRPLSWMSHMLDISLFGLNAGGHHLTNLLFHVANTLLLFALLNRLTRRRWPSAFVAALFAWHPLHVESVAWVAERKDVMCATFFLLTLWAYARYAESRTKAWYSLTLTGFILALMCKPMAVTLPCVFVLLDLWPLGRLRLGAPTIPSQAPAETFWRLLREKLPFFTISLLVGILTIIAQREVGTMTSVEHLPMNFRIANSLTGYGTYLRQLFWPVDLAIFYPLPRTLPLASALASALALAGISALVWIKRGQQPYLLMGWLWYLGILAPVIGLIQVGTQAYADRYTYLPMIGGFVMVTWYGAGQLESRRAGGRLPLLIAAAVLVLCLGVSRRQLQHWQTNETLFTHALDVTRDNYLAHYNLGTALAETGATEAAIRHFYETVRIYPIHAKAHNNLGGLLATQGKLGEAAHHCAIALKIEPTLAEARINLGVILTRLGKAAEAISHLQFAAQIRPDDAQIHYYLGTALAANRDVASAIAAFGVAVRLNATDPAARARLAWILATYPDARYRNGSAALQLASAAAKLTDHKHPLPLDALAAALAETGEFPTAAATAKTAARLAAEAGNQSFADAITRREQQYLSRQPYREDLH